MLYVADLHCFHGRVFSINFESASGTSKFGTQEQAQNIDRNESRVS